MGKRDSFDQQPICIWGHSLFGDTCPVCIENIKNNHCGADIHFLDPPWSAIYDQFFDGLEPGSFSECWIIPPDHPGIPSRFVEWSQDNYPIIEPIGLEDFLYDFFWGCCHNSKVHRLCKEPLCWNPLHLRSDLQIGWTQPQQVFPLELERTLEQSFQAQLTKVTKKWKFNHKKSIVHPLLNQNVIPGSKFNPLACTPLD